MMNHLRGNAIPTGLRVLSVECLGGCPWPCAAAFNALDKWRLRFTRLRPGDAADLLEAARAYIESGDGNLADGDLPTRLRGHISARSPCHPRRSDAALINTIVRGEGAT